MINPVLQRGIKGGHGRAAERNAGRRLNARLRPGSGAVEGAKGDLVLPEFLVESKSTVGESISIKLTWLRKIAEEALNVCKNPALLVQFVNSRGDATEAWVMIPERVYKELMNEVSRKEK